MLDLARKVSFSMNLPRIVAITFMQTRCSRGCSTNTFVSHSLIQSASDPFPPNLQNTFITKPYELGPWNFDRMFISLHVSHVTCNMSRVTCNMSQFI